MLCAGKRRRRRSARGCGVIEPIEDMTASSEPQDPLAFHRDSLTRPWIGGHAGLLDLGGEIAELPQFHPMAMRQTGGDRI